MKSKIEQIFKMRDMAVLEKDQELLLSTQVGEIPKSGSKGYLKIEKLTSVVLHAHNDNRNPSLWVVLVQEDYFHKDNFSHRGYLLYKLIDEDGKLLISEIVW